MEITLAQLPTLSRFWTVYLIHHSHVDIGYTRPQPIITREHAGYLNTVLDLCAASDHLPPGERFAWTCEVAWTIKQFLARYPERAEEFFRRVREGRIEVTGLYLQLTDLFSKKLLAYALSYAPGLAQQHGFEVVTAMNDDVNGWTWGLPKLLAERGIRYFDTAINNVRANNVEPRPRPYYWASPEGCRVLLWHGASYLHGNGMGLHHEGEDTALFDYLAELEREGYPHNAIQVKVQGELNDNAPPAAWLCERIHKWNQRYNNPKLYLGTSRTWFEHLEQHWPDPIHEHRLAWPDWWADGLGSFPYECIVTRRAQAEIESAEALAQSGAKLDPTRVEAAKEAAALFSEHTGGAWCSTDLPHSFESKAQLTLKQSYAYLARSESRALLRDALAASSPSAESPSVLVFNPLPYSRTGLVEVMIRDDAFTEPAERHIITRERPSPGPELHLLDIETGRVSPAIRRPYIYSATRYAAQLVRFVAHDVPPLGWRRYRIVSGSAEEQSRCTAESMCLDGPHFQVLLDESTGGLVSAVAKPAGRELVAHGEYALNQFIYEFIDSPRGREDLCYWGERHTDTPFRRRTPLARLVSSEKFGFGATVVMASSGENVPSLRSEVTIYDDLPRIDIINTITKQPSELSEAVYHAFPLAAHSPVVHLDLAGAVMRPGLDQVPGTATDWYAIQRYFAISDDDWTVVVATPDIPLVQVNGICTGKWQQELGPHTGTVMSWVMNNYWFTNFPAIQWGQFSYRYSIACQARSFDPAESGRFGDALRQPLLATVIPAP